MGLAPANWGPCIWASIHLICLGAPEQFNGNQLNYRKFFDALPYVLPCEKCRDHLIEHLAKHPMDAALAGGRNTLFVWSVQLHNTVNKSLGKPEMSVEDALQFWNDVANGRTSLCKNKTQNVKDDVEIKKPIYNNDELQKMSLLISIVLIVGAIILVARYW